MGVYRHRALPLPAKVGDARNTPAVHATALSHPCKQRSTVAAGATPSCMRPQPGSLSVAFRAHTAEEPETALPCRRSRALMPAASRGYIQRHIAAALCKLRQRHGSHRRTRAPPRTAIMYSSRDTSCIVPRAVPAMPRSGEDSDSGRQPPGAISRGTSLLHSASSVNDIAATVAQAHRRGPPSCTAAETQAALSRARCQQCPTATKTATVGGSLQGLYPEAHRCCTLQAPSTTLQPPSHKRTAADRHHVQQQRHKLHCPARGASNAPQRRRQRQWAAASRGYIQRHIAAALCKLRQRHCSHRRTSAPPRTAIMYSSRDTSCIVPRAVPAMPRGDEDSDCGRQERGTR